MCCFCGVGCVWFGFSGVLVGLGVVVLCFAGVACCGFTDTMGVVLGGLWLYLIVGFGIWFGLPLLGVWGFSVSGFGGLGELGVLVGGHLGLRLFGICYSVEFLWFVIV